MKAFEFKKVLVAALIREFGDELVISIVPKTLHKAPYFLTVKSGKPRPLRGEVSITFWIEGDSERYELLYTGRLNEKKNTYRKHSCRWVGKRPTREAVVRMMLVL